MIKVQEDQDWDAYWDCPIYSGTRSIEIKLFGVSFIIRWDSKYHEYGDKVRLD